MRKPVLTIFYQFNPWFPTIGGIQTIIRYFIKYAPGEFDVRLVGTTETTSSTNTWQDAELEGRAIQFFPLFTLQNDNVRSLIPTTIKYTSALWGRTLASDFMHFHRIEPTIATLKWSGDKTLFIHNDIQKQIASKEQKKAVLWRYFPAGYFVTERLLINQFTQILSCNTDSVKLYQQRYPHLANRIEYLKNPVDNEIFYPLTREKRDEVRRNYARQLGLSDDTSFVLFAGRLHPQKDPILLVRSIAALQQQNVHLLIAGEGELADEVQAEICQLGLSKQITMLGGVVQAKVAQLQQISSLFVLTSAYEGLPLVVLEALACGTPIVTTQCGETPNLLSANSGIVCQERTPIAIAEAISKVLLRSDDYSVESCVRAASPYAVRNIVNTVYGDMWQRWEQRFLFDSPTSYAPTSRD